MCTHATSAWKTCWRKTRSRVPASKDSTTDARSCDAACGPSAYEFMRPAMSSALRFLCLAVDCAHVWAGRPIFAALDDEAAMDQINHRREGAEHARFFARWSK